MLEPGRINNLPDRQVNEVKDDDHEKNGFVPDLQADVDLRSITCPRMFMTANQKTHTLPFRETSGVD